MIRLLLRIFAIAVIAASAQAQQQHFAQSRENTQHTFTYRWLDNAHEAHELTFSLPLTKIEALPTIQPNYRPAIAQRYVWVQMMESAKQIDPRTARVKIMPRGDELMLEIRARSETLQQEVQEQLREAQQQAFSDYLHSHYYTRFVTPYREQAVKPDHLRYIRESITPLIPLSQAFYEQVSEDSDARAYLNLLLGWVQSIPYDALNGRTGGNGSGFSPPLTLLTQNKGDCDSKAVLTAAATRAFLPDTPMVLVLLRAHAVLGLALTPLPGDTRITVNNTQYVMFDPTGPALQPFGQVSPETQRELASGLYTAETIR